MSLCPKLKLNFRKYTCYHFEFHRSDIDNFYPKAMIYKGKGYFLKSLEFTGQIMKLYTLSFQ